jgi:hypothetical protein
MADDQDYGAAQEDEAGRLLKKILSPAEAQSLVPPPPTHAPRSGPGESTPLTGSLAKPPSQSTPSRDNAHNHAKDEIKRTSSPGTSPRRGLAGYFAGASTQSQGAPDRSSDPQYVKVSSKGQVGYLPRANLLLAKQIDRNLKVLSKD